MSPLVSLLIAAFLLELALGDPVYPLHPVRLIGRCVGGVEGRLRRSGFGGVGGGALLVVAELGGVVFGYGILRWGLGGVHPAMAWVFDGYIVYSCIALRDMIRHARPVGSALAESDAHEAARRLQRIVARDTAQLDGSGLIRAAVESVAEGFVDGFLAPIFWFGAAGAGAAATGANSPQAWAVGAVLVYRSINTLDSMVGYRNKRYLKFGRVSARLDDVVNFIPARLSIPVLWLAAVIVRMEAGRGWRTALRDRLKHASPNSAHAESFVAGALGIRLGGPTVYSYGRVSKPWLGKGGKEPCIRDIESACSLVLVAGVVAVAGTTLLLAIFSF